ncbi:MAG: FkbM family methyltransferase [Flavobacteriales bacterium]|nr:FkbM family methyltransferase [Flavobacteriales bacterium]
MGIGRWIIRQRGSRKRHQGFFEKLLRMGAAGLGYGAPMITLAPEEEAVRQTVGNSLGPLTVFDVGANAGDYIALLQHTLPGRALVVHAFEPDPDLLAALERRFSGQPGITLMGAALSDHAGRATFHRHTHGQLSSLHAQVPGTFRETQGTHTFEVELRTLDEHCAAHGIPQIHLLKIDVEGHELFVLQGARRMLAEGRIDHIQFEFSDMNVASRTFFADFWQLLHPTHDLFRLCLDGLAPITQYDPLVLEIFHPVNFMAIRR